MILAISFNDDCQRFVKANKTSPYPWWRFNRKRKCVSCIQELLAFHNSIYLKTSFYVYRGIVSKLFFFLFRSLRPGRSGIGKLFKHLKVSLVNMVKYKKKKPLTPQNAQINKKKFWWGGMRDMGVGVGVPEEYLR